MEKIVTFPTDDNHLAYCLINQAAAEKAGRAIVIAHGFGCDPHDRLYEAAQSWFTAKGYDVIRLSFCGYNERERMPHHTSLTTQVEDLNNVLKKLAQDYSDISVIGHSFGGLTMLLANPSNISSMSFWDTTLYPDTKFEPENLSPCPHLQSYYYRDATDPDATTEIVGDAMLKQTNVLSSGLIDFAAGNLKTPSQFLFASDGTPASHVDSFFDAVKGPKEKITIDQADHFFTNPQATLQLFEKTFSWIETHAANLNIATRNSPQPKSSPGA